LLSILAGDDGHVGGGDPAAGTYADWPSDQEWFSQQWFVGSKAGDIGRGLR
jgi:hypothetical protein